MTRLARSSVLAALATMLCLSVPAIARPAAVATLDRSRLFNRSAEAVFSLEASARRISTFAAALFNVAVPDALAAPVSAQTVAAAPAHLTLRPSTGSQPAQTISAQAFATAAPLYADDAPLIAPLTDQPNAAALPSLASGLVQNPPVRFGAYQPYVPSLQTAGAQLTIPLRLGGIHFTAQVASAGMQSLHPDAFHILQVCGTIDSAAPCPYVSDTRAQSLSAAANFTLRAGNSRLNLQLMGGVDHIGFQQSAAFPYVPANPDVIAGDRSGSLDAQAPVLYYPGVTNVVKQSMGARLAVPVTPRVTVGLQYEQQHYQGEYGTLLFPGLNSRKDTYLGNVTYQMPSGSSAITLSARQYRYQEAPDYNLTQTRADLNFTVKF